MQITSRPKDFVTNLGRKALDSDFGTDLAQPDRDRLVLSAGAGALAGAALGTYLGFQGQQNNSVQEVWENRTVQHPHLEGYRHYTVTDYDTECRTEGYGEDRREVCTTEVEGWWHRYDPKIRNENVGSYQAPTFQNSEWAQPLLGGFLGALGGGLLGLGVGVGVNALKKSLAHGEQAPAAPPLTAERQERLAKTTGALMLGGAALGAVGGGLLGHASGAIEQSQKEIHTRSWSAPVLQREHLGNIPADYYEHNWGIGIPGFGIGFSGGNQGVYRDVPQYNPDGTVRMERVQHTFDTGRYGVVTGAVVGGLIGGSVGLATGVASGALLRLMESSKSEAKPQDSTPTGVA